jgi:hypothetical protein
MALALVARLLLGRLSLAGVYDQLLRRGRRSERQADQGGRRRQALCPGPEASG